MRMLVNKAGWAVAATLGVFLVAMITGVVRGGSLEPPGPPGPTDSVLLPGTPISSLPATINAPGHYYLTRNLSMSTAGNGITISANGVTLDLMGFELSGSGSAGKAIAQADANYRYGWVIRNGTISGWPGGGISAPGVFETRLESLLVRDMQLPSTHAVDVGPVALLKDIIVRFAGGYNGILTGPVARIEHCIVDYFGNTDGSGIETGDQSSIERSSVVGYHTGIRVGLASDVRNVNIRNSGTIGLWAAGFTTVKESMIGLNGTRVVGIFVSGVQHVISGNTIVANGPESRCIGYFDSDYFQIDGNVLVDCLDGILGAGDGGIRTRVVGNKFSNVADPVGVGGDIGPLAPARNTTSPWANLFGYF